MIDQQKIKVLIITYYWPPSGGSGVQRWMYFAKQLNQFNIEPTIITVDEKYASYPSRDYSFNKQIESLRVYKTKTLEPLRFYSFLKSGKSTKVIPQGNVGGKKKGFIDKIATYIRANFFIPDARVGWNKYAFTQAKKLIREEKFDFIITTGPPHSTHLVGLKLKKELNIKWLADFRDPWTEVFYNTLFKKTKKNEHKDKELEVSVLNDADIILTVGPSMRELLLNKVPHLKDKFYYIYNGFDSSKFENLVKVENNKFTIRYIGTLNENYPYESFIAAINKLEIKDIQIEFIGNIENSVQNQFISKCNKKITFIDTVSHSEAMQLMKNTDVLLLLLPIMENSKIMLTGKIFEYLATGNPILCIGNKDTDASRIIEESENSKQFEKDEISSIVNWLLQCKNEAITNNTSNLSKFSRINQAKELSEILKANIQ